jgi:hypothetical protein
VGAVEGTEVVGWEVGTTVGTADGSAVGTMDGAWVMGTVGLAEGACVKHATLIAGFCCQLVVDATCHVLVMSSGFHATSLAYIQPVSLPTRSLMIHWLRRWSAKKYKNFFVPSTVCSWKMFRCLNLVLSRSYLPIQSARVPPLCTPNTSTN